jgi:hypothetical protein
MPCGFAAFAAAHSLTALGAGTSETSEAKARILDWLFAARAKLVPFPTRVDSQTCAGSKFFSDV